MVTRVLLDTNILVYSRDEASPFFASTVKALKNIIINGAQPCIHRLLAFVGPRTPWAYLGLIPLATGIVG